MWQTTYNGDEKKHSKTMRKKEKCGEQDVAGK